MSEIQSTDKIRNPENQERPRLTVLLKVYYERPNKAPYEIEQGYTDILSRPDQVYQREDEKAYLTEWSKVEYGWVDKPSYIVIENTDEKNTLLVGFAFYSDTRRVESVCQGIKIPPGKFHPIDAIDHTSVMVRCMDEGQADDQDTYCSYTLHAIPG